MAADYITIKEPGFFEVVEKKSRFLGEAVHADTLADAEAYLAAVRKRHYDARHHCYAFVTGEVGTPDELFRSSDDGEPSGTAGKPILDILSGQGLHRSLIVVTRYFGGTLLGTGGLVRAYSAAAKGALEAAVKVTVRQGIGLRIACSYPAYGKLQYLFSKEGIAIGSTEFSDGVQFDCVAPLTEAERIKKLVTEATDGSARCTETGSVAYTE